VKINGNNFYANNFAKINNPNFKTLSAVNDGATMPHIVEHREIPETLRGMEENPKYPIIDIIPDFPKSKEKQVELMTKIAKAIYDTIQTDKKDEKTETNNNEPKNNGNVLRNVNFAEEDGFLIAQPVGLNKPKGDLAQVNQKLSLEQSDIQNEKPQKVITEKREKSGFKVGLEVEVGPTSIGGGIKVGTSKETEERKIEGDQENHTKESQNTTVGINYKFKGVGHEGGIVIENDKSKYERVAQGEEEKVNYQRNNTGIDLGVDIGTPTAGGNIEDYLMSGGKIGGVKVNVKNDNDKYEREVKLENNNNQE
jgi:hypothetical protein